jgi:hypothetical protein
VSLRCGKQSLTLGFRYRFKGLRTRVFILVYALDLRIKYRIFNIESIVVRGFGL